MRLPWGAAEHKEKNNLGKPKRFYEVIGFIVNHSQQ